VDIEQILEVHSFVRIKLTSKKDVFTWYWIVIKTPIRRRQRKPKTKEWQRITLKFFGDTTKRVVTVQGQSEDPSDDVGKVSRQELALRGESFKALI
jgi:hypothetical protein